MKTTVIEQASDKIIVKSKDNGVEINQFNGRVWIRHDNRTILAVTIAPDFAVGFAIWLEENHWTLIQHSKGPHQNMFSRHGKDISSAYDLQDLYIEHLKSKP